MRPAKPVLLLSRDEEQKMSAWNVKPDLRRVFERGSYACVEVENERRRLDVICIEETYTKQDVPRVQFKQYESSWTLKIFRGPFGLPLSPPRGDDIPTEVLTSTDSDQEKTMKRFLEGAGPHVVTLCEIGPQPKKKYHHT
jgi:hypothetical protein